MSQNPVINDRILELMQFLELSPSAFADEIGIQRPALTHIFKGRNKASLDVVQKIINRFPDTNILWLINGTGNMCNSTPNILKLQSKSAENKQVTPPDNLKNTLFEVSEPEPIQELKEKQEDRSPYTHRDFIVQSTVNESNPKQNPPLSPPSYPQQSKTDRKITKILVFFDDNTFQELT